MTLLFEHANKREIGRMRFQAALQGVDLDKNLKQVDKKTAARQKTQQQEGWFKDPAEYEHLSQEERIELTEKMMAQHRRGWIKERSEAPNG